MNNERVLFLSPHYDDAIFSCGSLMSHLVANDVVLDVATVFSSAITDELSPLAQRFHKGWEIEGDIMSLRTKEDMEALNMLGASQISLGFLDCIYRKKNGDFLIHNKKELYNSDFKDTSLLQNIEKAVSLILLKDDYSSIYLPIGIGSHIDHLLLTQLKLPFYSGEVYVYADMPYALFTKDMAYINGLIPVNCKIEDYCWDQYIKLMKCYKSQYRKNWHFIGEPMTIKQEIKKYFMNISKNKFNFVFWKRGI